MSMPPSHNDPFPTADQPGSPEAAREETVGHGPYPPYPSYPPYAPPGQPLPPPPLPAGAQGYPQGYPIYPQGYSAYPPGVAFPLAYPYPPAPRERNTTLWVVLSILGVLVLGACIACGIAVASFANVASQFAQTYARPLLVEQEFCRDEMSQDYTTAYQLFSSALQARTTQDQFVTSSQLRDQSDGIITNCQLTGAPTVGDSTATLTLSITRATSGTVSGDISLVLEGGQWKIAGIAPQLDIPIGGALPS